jgi:hypothetical protein
VFTVGAAGGEGCALMVTEVGVEMQVMLLLLLTKIIYEEPADTPANVAED